MPRAIFGADLAQHKMPERIAGGVAPHAHATAWHPRGHDACA
jgi:hypothetical protein